MKSTKTPLNLVPFGPDANLTLHEISEYYRVLKVPLVLTIGKMTISERLQYYQK